MRLEIEKRLGVDAYDIYGLSEIIGPGVAAECSEKAVRVVDRRKQPSIAN